MRRLRFFKRLINSFRGSQINADLRHQIEVHREMVKSDLLDRGMNDSDAECAARRIFGNEDSTREAARDEIGYRFIHELLQDLSHAFRSLSHSRGFTFVAIITIALGIGANTAVFSVVNAVLLKPLRTPDGDQLVRLAFKYPENPLRGDATLSLPQYNVVTETAADVFNDISAHRLDVINVTVQSTSRLLPVARVTANFFRLFGAPIMSGRNFSFAEDRPGGEHVAVLSYGIATREFGDYGTATGQTILLGGEPYQVIGIVGPSFDSEQFDQNPDIWIPFQIDPKTQDVGGEFCFVTARLKSNSSVEAVKAQLQNATNEYRQNVPALGRPGARFDAVPLRESMVASVKSSLIVLFGAVCLVLLIACTNVANLLLMQAAKRKRELAIRAALGASRWRLIRQLMTESALLALIGGALGLVIGVVGVRFLLALYPKSSFFVLGNNAMAIPRLGTDGSAMGVDWRVLCFTLFISFLATFLFGALPALQASRTDVFSWLKQAGSASSNAIRQHKTRSVLVVTEMALALILLIAATLLIRTSNALQAVDPGFNSKNVLTLRMAVTGTRFDKQVGIDELTRSGIERIRALPGVLTASTTCCVPLELVWQLPFTITGRKMSGMNPPFAEWTFVSPGYFDVFRIPIIRGRDFTIHDGIRSPGVVIINQTMARMYWPDSDPLDDSLVIGRGIRPDYLEDPVRRIVGIVGDVRDQTLRNKPRPEMYVPVAQVPDGVTTLNVRLLPLTWVVRTNAEPHRVSAAVEEELNRASGGLPVARVRSMEEVHADSMAGPRFYMWLMTVFGCSAVMLALVGVYSVTAYSVQQRTQEIGIRISLGAAPSNVRTMVIFQALSLAMVGVLIGNMGAILLTRFLSSLLFGVTAGDPATFIGASILLSGTVLAAIAVPARLATRVSPNVALRYE